MLGLMGTTLLWLSIFTSLLQILLPALGYYYRRIYLLASGRPLAIAQFVFIFCAYVLLTIAFINNDFSITYVATNSHPSLPFIFRLTALWGAHEGSILLWIFILNIWTMILSFSRHPQRLSLIFSILGLISFCFISFLLFTSNPFLPANEILKGQDLNPLLQDPGFVIHPPMLYIGYVGFSMTFAITLAQLITGHSLDKQWAYLTSRFTLVAWCFLTLGITLGSWWAYRVLGWGGFWFWDPVENASLLPWLTGTALLHTLLLVEKRSTAQPWAVFLAIICFALSLLGTFLVRSGLLISSHTFANDPKRGLFLLAILTILVICSLIIYTIRYPTITSPIKQLRSWFSRDNLLLANSLLFFVAMLTVLLGTLYPLIIDALHIGNISVGAPYFNQVMLPMVLISLIMMGLLPLCQWQWNEKKTHIWAVFKNALLSIVLGSLILWCFAPYIDLLSMLSLCLCLFILFNTLPAFTHTQGMSIAHSGFVILIMGILFSTMFNQEKEVRLRPGQTTHLGPYQFFFLDVKNIEGPNYYGMLARFDVVKAAHHVTYLSPEKRIYPVRDMVITKVAIHPSIFRDLYISLGEPLENDTWSLRLYYKPLIRWIWLGGLLMMLGGFLAFIQKKRKRVLVCQ